MNYGLAYVDKVPVVDALTRVGVANAALAQLSKSLELRPSYVGYYSRGINYLFWPKFFDRAKLGVADLETAVKMQKAGPKKPYYAHAWVRWETAIGRWISWRRPAPPGARGSKNIQIRPRFRSGYPNKAAI